MGNATSHEARVEALLSRKGELNRQQANLNTKKTALSANTETLKANVGQKIASIKEKEEPIEREIQKATQLLSRLQDVYR
jgi:hypothetical protein